MVERPPVEENLLPIVTNGKEKHTLLPFPTQTLQNKNKIRPNYDKNPIRPILPKDATSLEEDLRLGLDIQYIISEQNKVKYLLMVSPAALQISVTPKFWANFFSMEVAICLATESIAFYLVFLIPEALSIRDKADRSVFLVRIFVGLSSASLGALTLIKHVGLMKLGHK